jgi:tetratricopeptide (TPR) repeat protein
MDSGHFAEAERLILPSVASLTRIFGPDHVEVTRAQSDVATLRRKQGRFDEARTTVEHVMETKIRIKGPTHPEIAFPLVEIGMQDVAKGEPAQALAPYQRALEIRAKALGADHILTQEATIRLAGALAVLGRCAEARPLLATARAALEKLDGGAHPFFAEALTVSGTCDLSSGRAQQAVASLSRALEIDTKVKAPALDRGSARWPLARALWSLGQHDAAVAAATTAERELTGDADGARDRAAAHAWLATHRHD